MIRRKYQWNFLRTYTLLCLTTIYSMERHFARIEELFIPRDVRLWVQNLSCIRLYQSVQKFLETFFINFALNKKAVLQSQQTSLSSRKNPLEYTSDKCSRYREPMNMVLHPAQFFLLNTKQKDFPRILAVHNHHHLSQQRTRYVIDHVCPPRVYCRNVPMDFLVQVREHPSTTINSSVILLPPPPHSYEGPSKKRGFLGSSLLPGYNEEVPVLRRK